MENLKQLEHMLLLMRLRRNKSQRRKEEKGREKEKRDKRPCIDRMTCREKILNYFSATETPKAIVLPAFFLASCQVAVVMQSPVISLFMILKTLKKKKKKRASC